MTTSPNESVILNKTLELCQAIVAQPEFQTLRRQIDAFMADEKAQAHYHSLSEKGRALHNKQHQGQPLSNAEVAAFDKDREAFFANPVARGFVEAQQQMQSVQETVGQYVVKTYELGRVPQESDFESGCCGGHKHDHEDEGCCGGKHHQGHGAHEHGGEGCGCRH